MTLRIASGPENAALALEKQGFLVLVFLMVWLEKLWEKIHKINGVAMSLTYEWE